MMFTSFLVPIGLLMYGWSADKHLHWIVPDIGAMIACIGEDAASCANLGIPALTAFPKASYAFSSPRGLT